MIRRANDVEYGLCACVWSENSGVTHRVAQAMEVRVLQYMRECVSSVGDDTVYTAKYSHQLILTNLMKCSA